MAAHWFEAIVAVGILLILAVAAMVDVGLEDLETLASPPEFPDESSDDPDGALADEEERAPGRAQR